MLTFDISPLMSERQNADLNPWISCGFSGFPSLNLLNSQLSYGFSKITESMIFMWMQWLIKPESTEFVDFVWIWIQACKYTESTVNLQILCKSTDLNNLNSQIYCGFRGFHQPKIHQFQACHHVWSFLRKIKHDKLWLLHNVMISLFDLRLNIATDIH